MFRKDFDAEQPQGFAPTDDGINFQIGKTSILGLNQRKIPQAILGVFFCPKLERNRNM